MLSCNNPEHIGLNRQMGVRELRHQAMALKMQDIQHYTLFSTYYIFLSYLSRQWLIR